MKSLRLSVVMLAFICLCAVSANAQVTLDSFDGNSCQLDSHYLERQWSCDVEYVPRRRALHGRQYNFSGNPGGAVYDNIVEKGWWNLTGVTSLFYYAWQAPTGVVNYDTITLGMGNGASYVVTFPDGQMGSGWCGCTSPGGPSTWTLQGGAADLGDVTSVTISAYSTNGVSGVTDIYYLDLTANGAAGGAGVATITETSGSNPDCSGSSITLDAGAGYCLLSMVAGWSDYRDNHRLADCDHDVFGDCDRSSGNQIIGSYVQTVGIAPAITTQPTTQWICSGTASFTVRHRAVLHRPTNGTAERQVPAH